MSLPDWTAPVIERLGATDGRYEAGGKLRFRCPFPERHKNGDEHPSAWLRIGDNGLLMWGCACGISGRKPEILAAGLRVVDFYPPERRPANSARKYPPRKRVATYPYTDAAGVVLAVKDKFSPGSYGTPKSYEWRRPVGSGGWAVGADVLAGGLFARCGTMGDGSPLYRKGGAGAEVIELPRLVPPVYNLHALATAAEGRSVWCVEGEKDVETLARCGVLATCGPFASNDLPREYLGHLYGRVVVACGDNDDPGRAYLDHVTAAAVRNRAAAVVLVDWEAVENPPGVGGDVSDWLAVQPGYPDPKACRAALWGLRRWATTYTLNTGKL